MTGHRKMTWNLMVMVMKYCKLMDYMRSLVMLVSDKESIMYKMFNTIKTMKYLEVFHSSGRIERVQTRQAENLNLDLNLDLAGQPDGSDAQNSNCIGKLLSKQKNLKKYKKTKKKLI